MTFYNFINANTAGPNKYTFPDFSKSSKWSKFYENSPEWKILDNVCQNDQLKKKLSSSNKT